MKRVLNKFILVKQDKEEQTGFAMSPNQAANEQYQYGVIHDISEEAQKIDEKYKLNIGDRIIFSRSRASKISTPDAGWLLIIRADDVVSVV